MPFIPQNVRRNRQFNRKSTKESISAQSKKRANMESPLRELKSKSILKNPPVKKTDSETPVTQKVAPAPTNRTVHVVRQIVKEKPTEEEQATVKADAERRLDSLIRSMKPSFHRGIVDQNENESRSQNTKSVLTFSEVQTESNEQRKRVGDEGNQLQSLSDSRKDTNVSNQGRRQSRKSSNGGALSELFSKKPYECGNINPPEPSNLDENFTRLDEICTTKGNSKFVTLPVSKRTIRIPIKKIIPIKRYPEDPLYKLRKEKRLFSLGFKPKERHGSICTEEDNVMMHPVGLARLFEAYTKNMGRDWLFAMTKGSIMEAVDSDDEQIPPHWSWMEPIVDDPTQRFWNWDKSLVNSKSNRGSPARLLNKNIMGDLYMDDSIDNYRGSLGPNDFDAKSDLAALMIEDTDSSTDIEFDENDFVRGNHHHPFTDPVITAGYQHRCKARDKYHRNVRGKSLTDRSTDSMISEMGSLSHEYKRPIEEPLKGPPGGDGEQHKPSRVLQIDFRKSVELGDKRDDQTTIEGDIEELITGRTDSTIAEAIKTRKRVSRKRKRSSKWKKSSTVGSTIQSDVDSQLMVMQNESFLEKEQFNNLEAGFENVAIDWCKVGAIFFTLLFSQPNVTRTSIIKYYDVCDCRCVFMRNVLLLRK